MQMQNKTRRNNCDFINSKKCMRFHHYTKKQKDKLAKEINPITIEDADSAFTKLAKLSCDEIKRLANTTTKIGNDAVDFFTQTERFSTKGHSRIDFYTLWHNRKEFSKISYIKKRLEYFSKTRKNLSEIRVWKYIFNLYFSSINIFKPIIAMNIYCLFKPKYAVLDMTMGWGGRLVGACALNVPKYIGIDSNQNLKTPYDKMSEFLSSRSTTKIDLYFQDALTFDYSKHQYDLVLTSPPYYDLEVYNSKDDKKYTKEEWNELFYKPLIQKSWDNLMTGGYYCFNVPVQIYEDVCIPLLGESDEQIILAKNMRFKSEENKYTEYIYVWKK